MLVNCCDFCMKILKTDKDKYTYTVDYKQYELCEECYDDLVEIANKKEEAIDKVNNIFVSDFNKLLERKKGNEKDTKEDNI